MMPSAAASPKADPPASMIAFAGLSAVVGSARCVSRAAGPPPETSMPTLAPSSKISTVTPVFASASWALPTRTPSMSVILICPNRSWLSMLSPPSVGLAVRAQPASIAEAPAVAAPATKALLVAPPFFLKSPPFRRAGQTARRMPTITRRYAENS